MQSVKVAIDDWHVNHIRLPLSQDRWFGKAPEQKDEGKAYRALVKEVVDLCASKGCYIILDLHWSDAGEWGQNIGQHSMPDENSLAFWKDLAPVYANHPAVIYDLYNEPHDVTWDIWLNGGTVTDKPGGRRGGEPKTFQAVGMQTLLDAVRATGAKNVIIVGGLNWAYDFDGILDGRQLKDPNGNGVIYANHAYNNKGHSVDVWIARMEQATAKLPVIVSEFGGSGGPNRRVRRFGADAPPEPDRRRLAPARDAGPPGPQLGLDRVGLPSAGRPDPDLRLGLHAHPRLRRLRETDARRHPPSLHPAGRPGDPAPAIAWGRKTEDALTTVNRPARTAFFLPASYASSIMLPGEALLMKPRRSGWRPAWACTDMMRPKESVTGNDETRG